MAIINSFKGHSLVYNILYNWQFVLLVPEEVTSTVIIIIQYNGNI